MEKSQKKTRRKSTSLWILKASEREKCKKQDNEIKKDKEKWINQKKGMNEWG